MPAPIAPRQTRIMAEQLMSGNPIVKVINATTQLLPTERNIDVQTVGAAYTITLPSVAECEGMSFRFYMSARGGAFNATITHKASDSLGWTDLVMDGVGDNLLIYSDGLTWHPTKIGVA